jgi:hypothetical protein
MAKDEQRGWLFRVRIRYKKHVGGYKNKSNDSLNDGMDSIFF